MNIFRDARCVMRFFILLPLMLILLAVHALAGNIAPDISAGGLSTPVSEHGLRGTGTLRAGESTVVVLHLEAPGSNLSDHPGMDTGSNGVDAVTYKFDSPGPRNFCFEGKADSGHSLIVRDMNGKQIVALKAGGACSENPVEAAEYALEVTHGNARGDSAPVTVFIVAARKPGENNKAVRLSANGCESCDMAGAVLRSAYLRSADLRKVRLQGADLTGADLESGNLEGADLKGTDFSGANLSKTNMRFADAEGIILNRATSFKTMLSYAKMRNAKMNAVSMKKLFLAGADVRGAEIRGSELIGADMRNADLSGADFSGSNLSGAYFHSAKLVGSNMSNVNLTSVNITSADMTDVDFTDTDLKDTVDENKIR